MNIKKPDVMFSRRTLFHLTFLGALWVTGQGGGLKSLPCFKCSVLFDEGEKHNWS